VNRVAEGGLRALEFSLLFPAIAAGRRIVQVDERIATGRTIERRRAAQLLQPLAPLQQRTAI
jgi:hypothetical protein